MKFSREELEQVGAATPRGRRGKNGHDISEISSTLLSMSQAAVPLEMLTNDPNWDRFLSLIQATLERTRQQRDLFVESAMDPELHSPEKISYLRTQAMICDERIRCFESVISLPKDIMEVGERARLKLAEIGQAESENLTS